MNNNRRSAAANDTTTAKESSKFVTNLLTIIFIEYLYRLCVQAPISVIRSFSRHPLSIFIAFLLLFPLYLFIQFFVYVCKFIIQIFSRHHPYLYTTIKFLVSNSNSASSDANRRTTQQHGFMSNDEDDEDNNLQQYQGKCSICFDADLDLCLKHCRDQFCLECFQRYVSEVVKSSWGLSVTKIRCPVCNIQIPQDEWTKFVPASVVETYNKFNRPYRSFSRCCPKCETEVIACDFPRLYIKGQSRVIASLLRDFFETINLNTPRESDFCTPSLEQQEEFVRLFEKTVWRSSTLIDIHRRLIQQLIQSCQVVNQMDIVKLISQKILQLEMKPDTWRRLQFDYITFFPTANCPTCNMAVCLQCGNHAHSDMSCKDNMKRIIVQKQANNELIETLKWKIENSRSCPSCSIMIHRDDGCNKVDCTMCGFSFCWVCQSSWAETGCAYFACSNEQNKLPSLSYDDSGSSGSTSKTELGVPNVDMIHSKLNNNI
ncbi:MAG: hypothetical protein EXX96DRAFT_565567 [Benjaminiella poitrasii]|nr:MAG: hypothetical protein EXX96DRAFT_565567 [Benjaminiella poitrasii]